MGATRWAVVVLLAMGFASSAHARTWVIEPGGGGDAGTIQAAIDSAGAGDTILLSPGDYTGSGNTNVDFAGKSVVVTSRDGPTSTTIDCDGAARAFVFRSGETEASRLSGVTIVDGFNNFFGGAVYCVSSSPTIERNVFINNLTGFQGGAIYCDSSAARIAGNTFQGNFAPFGAGLWLSGQSTVEVYGNYFIDNGGDTTLQGGGIACNASSPVIRSNRFVTNRATFGGGICTIAESAPVIEFNTFERDSAVLGGGIGSTDSSPDTIRNNVFRANFAAQGGAVLCDDVSLAVITNNTFDANVAQQGAAIHCSTFSDATIDANIFVANIGVPIETANFAQPWIGCCDLYGNVGGDGMPASAIDGGGNFSADPQFCGSAGSGNYYITATSPAAPAHSPCGVLVGAFGVGCTATGVDGMVHEAVLLHQNYPNPFNPSTTIPYEMPPGGAHVRIDVIDAHGRVVRTLVDGYRAEGRREALWDGRTARGDPASSGVYFCRVRAAGAEQTRKITLVK